MPPGAANGSTEERLALLESRQRAQEDKIKDLEDRNKDLEALLSALNTSDSKQKAKTRQLQSQMSYLNASAKQLESQMSSLNTSVSETASSTYVHWGSSKCSAPGAQTVYSGVVGGSHYTHTGAATNPLCLPFGTNLSNRKVPTSYAVLYGSAYQTFDDDHNKDPECAVCRASFPTTVMVAGTDSCQVGWKKQYSGYLMAGDRIHKAGSQYICVDSRMESVDNSDAQEDGKFLFLTVTQCGSLPCGMYTNNTIVTCAVCSK